jgi:hypothetical protein
MEHKEKKLESLLDSQQDKSGYPLAILKASVTFFEEQPVQKKVSGKIMLENGKAIYYSSFYKPLCNTKIK